MNTTKLIKSAASTASTASTNSTIYQPYPGSFTTKAPIEVKTVIEEDSKPELTKEEKDAVVAKFRMDKMEKRRMKKVIAMSLVFFFRISVITTIFVILSKISG